MAPDPLPSQALASERLQALQALAIGVAGAQGQPLQAVLERLAQGLGVRYAVAAVFADETRAQLRTLGAVVDGKPAPGYDYALDGSPCFCAATSHFRYRAGGAQAPFAATSGAAAGLSSFAAFPLVGSAGKPLGMLLVADTAPVAGGDAAHAQAMLAIAAARLVAEVERARSDEVLQAIALAVSRSRSDAVFDGLVQLMATVLGVEVAFISRYRPEDAGALTMLSMYYDGELLHDARYNLLGTPCETVLGQAFRAYTDRLQVLFPDDQDVKLQNTESYAGYPLTASDGAKLGVLAVASRRPMGRVDRIEAMLQIFAVRVVAEMEALAAREALDRSEASYRAIFDAAEDAILVLDWRDSAIVDANRKACEAYGYTREELVRMTCGDLAALEANYARERMAPYFEAAKQGRCEPFEWHRCNRDGSRHWDEVHLKPVTLGGRRRILAFSREITDRKQALEQLKLREEQYRLVFELSSDALFLWDPEMRLVDANPAGLAMYGYTPEQRAQSFEAIGAQYREGLPPEYLASRLEMLQRAARGESTHLETPSLRADGTWFDADLRVIPFPHRGKPHALAVIRDVSERRRRERELQRSEARLRATVEAAFDGVIAMDHDGLVVEFNAAAERVFGWRREEAIGAKLSELILPERFRAAHERGLALFHQSGRGPMVGRLVETTACRRDGSEIPVELAISVAAVPEGSIFVGHLRDISARRAAEAQRSALEAQLRQAQKMEAIGQLTGGIAHDFNNILTSVMGYVVLAHERADHLGDATLARQLGQAHLAAQRARDLIAQMLAFARRQKGDPRALELTPLARQTLRLLRSTLPSSIALDAQWFDADGAGQAAWVRADPVQLEQILFNLCINARDAMQGSGRITVRLGRRSAGTWQCASCKAPVEGGPWVELSVADTGSGIAPELLDRIFDPFFSTKAPGQGSGMGLAMVHGIVHDHGGHVLVETSGQGTRFAVLLPPAAAAVPALAGGGEGSPMHEAPLRARVLLVEDDASVGDYLSEQLAAWGLEVALVRDPLRAVDWLADAARAADLVLTDLTMPQMTGLQLAREVRRLRPALPVLLVTGHGGDLDESEVRASGVTRVMKKPVEPAALRAMLRELVSHQAH